MKNVTEKVLSKHLLEGNLVTGEEIKIKVDQTLTQDSTGTMVYLQLDAMHVPMKQTELSVAYVDHNTLQSGFENADDHEFIRTAAAKYGLIYSKPGNGICHQVHLERFSIPGKTLIGSDSHTPTSGAMGMIAIGAGGLDVAVGIGKGYYYLQMPKVKNIVLKNKLRSLVSAKDVILFILKTLTVKGGVGYILEYSGEGIKCLSLTDRATICNMGAELGATTSIFPSDGITRDYLSTQGRSEDYIALAADQGATYDDSIEIDLSVIEPLLAAPHSPDNIVKVTETMIKVDQVAIGSCTNSSITDLLKVAKILKGNKVASHVSLVVSPGSASVLKMLSDSGALGDMIQAGARILESACGPCIGMGQAPRNNAISLRTFNRNFKGRCGTDTASVYLCSPEVAAYSAIKGMISDPRELGSISIDKPIKADVIEHFFLKEEPTELVLGPNIKPFPLGVELEDFQSKVLLKVGDNITTDDIVPSNAKLLPYRSNVPKLSEYCFGTIMDNFKSIADANNGGIIYGGDNYGQGSSREHAALVPLYLGVRAVIAKSFARIHKANLINSGILPLIIIKGDIDQGDMLNFKNIREQLKEGNINILNITKNTIIEVQANLSDRELEYLLAGGLINSLRRTL